MKNIRELAQEIVLAISLIISFGALFVSYQSYNLAKNADERQTENISVDVDWMAYDIVLEYENGKPQFIHNKVKLKVTKLSLIDITISACNHHSQRVFVTEEEIDDSPFSLIGGSRIGTCETKFLDSKRMPVTLPFTLSPGEVLFATQRVSSFLSEEIADHYNSYLTFADRNDPDKYFIGYLCDKGIALREIVNILGRDNCLPEPANPLYIERLIFQTSRNNVFSSRELLGKDSEFDVNFDGDPFVMFGFPSF